MKSSHISALPFCAYYLRYDYQILRIWLDPRGAEVDDGIDYCQFTASASNK